jgi:glycerol kinase
MKDYVIAIDQGTTSSRAIVFDTDFRIVATGQREFEQHFPDSGWVEHEPEDIWDTTVATVREAIAKAGVTAGDIAAIGITNQRETTLIWDRDTGKPIHRAIVWQDRRTAAMCERLKEDGLEPTFSEKTGLLLDPYFSGTKIAWLLDKVPGARARAKAGKLAFGTVDSFLLWRLSGGMAHVTDASNASRTLLYNIRDNAWDEELLKILEIPDSLLPVVKDCADDFGETTPRHVLNVARSSPPTARVALWCSIPVTNWCVRKTVWSAPLAIACAAKPPMPWRARSSSPGPLCNGCVTA